MFIGFIALGTSCFFWCKTIVTFVGTCKSYCLFYLGVESYCKYVGCYFGKIMCAVLIIVFCFLGTKQLTFIRVEQNFVISSMYGFIEAHVLPGRPYMFTLIASCFVSTSKTTALNPCLHAMLRVSP